MAEALLKGWNAPALVSAVTIDAKSGHAVREENATVTDWRADGSELQWTEMEGGLPLPLLKDNALTALLLKLTDIEKALNQEPLRVTGLEDSREYTLNIDGQRMGTFTGDELERGVNLAEYNTPMRQQAQGVSWDVRDLVETHYVHTRMRVNNADTGGEDGANRLQGFEDSLEDKIYARATPMPHHFELKPAQPPATQSAQ
jgi:hypothetical protein